MQIVILSVVSMCFQVVYHAEALGCISHTLICSLRAILKRDDNVYTQLCGLLSQHLKLLGCENKHQLQSDSAVMWSGGKTESIKSYFGLTVIELILFKVILAFYMILLDL